jgi:NADP-dependent 3-hydroxy acid dehydrogenase YdfG
MSNVLKQIIVVTGGTSGIGMATVKKVASEPSNLVVVAAKTDEKLQTLKASMQAQGFDNIVTYCIDLTESKF